MNLFGAVLRYGAACAKVQQKTEALRSGSASVRGRKKQAQLTRGSFCTTRRIYTASSAMPTALVRFSTCWA